jgi:hypothetical protein
MGTVVFLAGLAFAAIAVIVTFTVVAIFFKIALKLILLPLLLLKWIVMGVVMMVLGPILILAGIVAAIAMLVGVLIPLLPFLVLGGIVWLLVRSNRRPAVVA